MVSMKKFERIRTGSAIGTAMVLTFVMILLTSSQPLRSIYLFTLGPLKNMRYIGNIIELAIPLIFSGLSMSLFFQAKLFNLGADGIYYFSGITAAAIAIRLPQLGLLLPFACMTSGIVIGILISAIPGIMKSRWDASELVSSLMCNSIFAGIGLYLLNYRLRDPDLTEIASLRFDPAARLPGIVPGTRIHAGLLIAVLLVVLVTFVLYKTPWGFKLRIYGMNSSFAGYAGMDTRKIIFFTHLAAGGIAGLGGTIEILGMYDRFRWTGLPGLGFDGALIALLAHNKPERVIFASLFIAYIRNGAYIMSRLSDVPSEMIAILQAMIILLISAERFLQSWRERQLIEEIHA
jgi:general nucleoside transport system permease protein